jgi:acetyl esterase/lipase
MNVPYTLLFHQTRTIADQAGGNAAAAILRQAGDGFKQRAFTVLIYPPGNKTCKRVRRRIFRNIL